MTEEERQYVRDHPELKDKELAKKFGVTKDLIHGIRKVRHGREVDLKKWPAETEFIRKNSHMLDGTLLEALRRLTGRNITIYWVERIKWTLRDETRLLDAQKETQPELEFPWASVDFGSL